MICNRTRLVVLLTTVCGLAVCGCATADGPTLREARNFENFSLYYSGDAVRGRSLTDVLGDAGKNETRQETTWVFLYGECEDPPADAGCAPPLQIHNEDACIRTQHSRPEASELFSFRGAKASRPSDGAMEIYTGRTVVEIAGRPGFVFRAARLLRNVRQARPARLPAPAPGVLNEQPCKIPPA
jgi:hypothetical protein